MMTPGRWGRRGASLGLASLLPVLWLLISCTEDTVTPEQNLAGLQIHKSDLTHDLDPAVSADDLATLVASNQQFTLDIYHALREDDQNLLVSPLSIRTAFVMVYGGARGETAAQMAQVLRYPLGQELLHPAFNALQLALAARNHPGDGQDQKPIELLLANSFWGNRGDVFVPEFLDLLAVHYGADIRTLDFSGQSDACRRVINDWVAAHTRQRILDLLPVGSLTELTVAVLTNALYLKAPWALPFAEDATADGLFFRLDGSSLTVPFMHQEEIFAYAEGEGWQALELTYQNEELGMVLLLPAPGSFAAFEAQLTAPQLAAILSELELARVAVCLPRFTFESEFRLKATLQSLGMELPFLGQADFSGIIASGGIWIDEAYHKTFITVDEKGTEAAAATAVVIIREISADPAPPFDCNRPFLFLIRDRLTGAVIFLGKVVQPA